jgi:hypothetical protein
MEGSERQNDGQNKDAHPDLHIDYRIYGKTGPKGRRTLSSSKPLETLGYNRSNRLCHVRPVRLFEQVWRTVRGFHSVSGCRPSLVSRVDNE